MKAQEYINKIAKVLSSRHDVTIKEYPLHYKAWIFSLLKIQSKKIISKDKIILITSWIHGEEIAGPLSLLTYINKIIDFIHDHGYKVIIYPLNNPSGFQQWTRYNIDGDRWSCGNNDFLRYELSNGKLVDELPNDGKFKKRYRSSDAKLKQKLPLETILLHKLLKQDPLKQIVANIDLHQDYITPKIWAATHFYSFNNIYQSIITTIKKYIPVLTNKIISAGQRGGTKSDAYGCIIRHDGAINDLFNRLGVKHTITIETTGKTPLSLAKKINRFWIQWLVLLLHHETLSWQNKPSSSKNIIKKRK
jgi:hypothetical protein